MPSIARTVVCSASSCAAEKGTAVPECIHGFEPGLCDSCYPKVVPEKPKVPRSAAVPRRIAGVTMTKKSISAADQRIYHVTHIRNLAAILDTGELRADTRPLVDVSTELTRELRRTAEVRPGESVADHVPFYLAPDASLWQQLRGGALDETRWSGAARAAASGDFVFLVSTARALGDDAVISDADAAGSVTRFTSTPDEADRMLVRLHNDDRARDAEALARYFFAFDAVQLVGVANEPMRDRVRAMLHDADFATKVAVYPPWFQLG